MTRRGQRSQFDSVALSRLQEVAQASRDTTFVSALIQMFVDDAIARLGRLSSAIELHDDPGVRGLAHALHGGAATFGARDLVERCVALEELPTIWRHSLARRRYRALNKAFDEARAALELLADGQR